MKTVTTKITIIERGVPDENTSCENIDQYKEAVYEMIRGETDTDAEIKVSVEII